MTTVTIYPNGAGDLTELTPSTGSNYQNVDETSSDDDITYNSHSSGFSDATKTDLYAIPDQSLSGNINKITIYTNTKNGSATWHNTVARALKIGGTVYTSSPDDIVVENSYTLHNTEWATNPATSAAWSWTDINNLQIGLQTMVKAFGGWVRVTQCYVVVDYTETAGTVIPVFMNQYRQRR